MLRPRKKITVGFKGFWKGFTLRSFIKRHPYLLNKYDLQESPSPDYLFISVFGDQPCSDILSFQKSVKIFYTGENREPDMELYDFALSFSLTLNENHYRLPCWVPRMYANGMHPEKLLSKFRKKVTSERIPPGFCNYIFKHRVDCRERFFKELNAIRPVSAPGFSCNNVPAIGPSVADKINYQKQFRFSISSENQCCKGYVTEKITEAFAARTVPIYMGDPDIGKDFNEESFVNILSTNDYMKTIERVITLDNNRSLYLDAINAPVFVNDSLPEYAHEENIMSFFDRIFS
jgi:hypothetical protein